MSAFLRFWGLVVLIVTILVLVTIFLMKKFNDKDIAKYIPTFMMWAISIIFFVIATFFAQPMQDLGYFVMSMITGLATLITLIITIIITKVQDRKRKK